MHPDAIFLSSSSNEDQTEGDIMEMGERLANEVRQYIQSFCPVSCLARISFIGHSLGGIIIRAALPHLEEFKDKFYTYMSLSSPHLGYMYNSSKLFDAGMWFFKKWRKVQVSPATQYDRPEEYGGHFPLQAVELPGLLLVQEYLPCLILPGSIRPFRLSKNSNLQKSFGWYQEGKPVHQDGSEFIEKPSDQIALQTGCQLQDQR